MNLPRVMAVARKEARQIVRDSRSMYLALGIPVVLMFLFGYALSLDVDHIPIGVWDQDRSPQSREFVDRLTSSGVLYVGVSDRPVRRHRVRDRPKQDQRGNYHPL